MNIGHFALSLLEALQKDTQKITRDSLIHRLPWNTLMTLHDIEMLSIAIQI